MKKISLFLIIFAIFSQNYAFAKQNKIFLGIEGLNVKTEHFFSNNIDVNITESTFLFTPIEKKASSSSLGFGLNLGYIGYYGRFFAAPEIFFDQLNNNTQDFFAAKGAVENPNPIAYKNDEISTNFRYGAKVNLGVNVIGKIDVFGTVGFANVDYDIRYKTVGRGSQRSYGGSEFSMLYGFGTFISLHRHLILKIAQDYQEIEARYLIKGYVDTIKLETTRVGLAYSF